MAELAECYGPLQSMADAVSLPLLVLDPSRRVVIWNMAAQSAFGWTRQEMLGQGLPRWGFLPEGQHEDWTASIDRVLTSGAPLQHMVSQIRHQTGRASDTAISMSPLKDARGAPIGVIVTALDVAERTRFLQIAAHELRNPMASVKGAVALIQSRLAAGRTLDGMASVLAMIEQEVDRLSSILNEVLSGFQAAAGQLEVIFSPVNLVEVLVAALRPFQAASGSHRFVLEDCEQSEVWVSGDARRLEDVVRNLLSNARKYSPAGGDIRVGLQAGAKSVRVAVRDAGTGIPVQELTNIFLPFHRAPVAAGRDPGGAGLGLYLCATIIREHGGRIWAQNNPDAGATIHFELPLAAGAIGG